MMLADWLSLFFHFLLLSMLSIGGAISTTPDMHRYLVTEQGWLNHANFNASIALAQAAPGPNLLFVAVLGWNVAGWAGALATTAGILLPSSTLVLMLYRWREKHHHLPSMQAFSIGMMPLTIGLMLATGWVLAEPAWQSSQPWVLLGLIALTTLLSWRRKINPLWLMLLGGLVGLMTTDHAKLLFLHM